MKIRYDTVTVQVLYESKRAKGKLIFAPQRKPIGTIDLRGISNKETFMKVWKETMGNIYGTFSLLARGRRGRFAKSLGVIVIRKGFPLEIKDNRCALYILFKKRTSKREAEKLEDFVISGR